MSGFNVSFSVKGLLHKLIVFFVIHLLCFASDINKSFFDSFQHVQNSFFSFVFSFFWRNQLIVAFTSKTGHEKTFSCSLTVQQERLNPGDLKTSYRVLIRAWLPWYWTSGRQKVLWKRKKLKKHNALYFHDLVTCSQTISVWN